MTRKGLCILALWTLACALTRGQEECVACHSDSGALRQVLGDPIRRVDSLLIDQQRLARSVHGSRSCEDCHMDFGGYPHAEDRTTASCNDCHDEAAAVYAKSVHGGQDSGGAPLVSCSACHGVHDVFKRIDRESRLHPLNIHVTCTECHHRAEDHAPDEARFKAYASDEHARGIIFSGLTVSATCVSCHGAHEIVRASDPGSPVSRSTVAATCGHCHVIPFEEYQAGVHHARQGIDGQRPATCTDCHQPHAIAHTEPGFIERSVSACSECHDERGTSFKLSYHGKVHTLGFDRRVATCNTCHGNHGILPSSDPRSPTHEGNLVATCGQCHEGSHAGFTSFLVHANPLDGSRFPALHAVYLVMLGLIITVMAFGALHVILWLFRSLLAREWRLKHEVHAAPGRTVRRMRPLYLGINAVATVAILLLAWTGLPLYFSGQPWARGVMSVFGGTAAAAFVHRVSAIVLMATFAFFIGQVAWRLFVKRERGLLRGPWSMLPRARDFKDLAGNIRWFLGRGPKPRFGRWIYWEKFDFWAVFWGMGIMGLTGFMLWFPVASSRFVPGWMLNVAGVIHGMEALLAIAFHFAVQAYQTHLRPDKFPLDAGFYTGLVPEAELQEERPEEYEILKNEGKLEALVSPPPRPGALLASRIFGGATLVLGLLLLALTVTALLAGPSSAFEE